MKRPVLASSLIALAAVATAAAAQDTAYQDERINMVIIYGDDQCPASTGDLITVCARKPESERYRIPEALRTSDDPANTSWAERVESFEAIGDFGTLSCSTAGIGGFTGCTQELIEAAYGEKETSSSVRFSQLIAAARAERLSTIDEEAAAEQERVEQIEREYMERLERERKAELPGEEPLPVPESENRLGEVQPEADGPQG